MIYRKGFSIVEVLITTILALSLGAAVSMTLNSSMNTMRNNNFNSTSSTKLREVENLIDRYTNSMTPSIYCSFYYNGLCQKVDKESYIVYQNTVDSNNLYTLSFLSNACFNKICESTSTYPTKIDITYDENTKTLSFYFTPYASTALMNTAMGSNISATYYPLSSRKLFASYSGIYPNNSNQNCTGNGSTSLSGGSLDTLFHFYNGYGAQLPLGGTLTLGTVKYIKISLYTGYCFHKIARYNTLETFLNPPSLDY